MAEITKLNQNATEDAEEREKVRLFTVYSGLPANKKAVAEGLIVEAARLRVLLDELFEDIRENGATELFTQSEKTAPYEKERPAAKLYATYNKNYQSIIKQLNDLTPPETKTGGKLGAFMNDD